MTPPIPPERHFTHRTRWLHSSLLGVAVLGALAARAGGAKVTTAAIRVTFWGALAMALTAAVGALFGAAV